MLEGELTFPNYELPYLLFKVVSQSWYRVQNNIKKGLSRFYLYAFEYILLYTNIITIQIHICICYNNNQRKNTINLRGRRTWEGLEGAYLGGGGRRKEKTESDINVFHFEHLKIKINGYKLTFTIPILNFFIFLCVWYIWYAKELLWRSKESFQVSILYLCLYVGLKSDSQACVNSAFIH